MKVSKTNEAVHSVFTSMAGTEIYSLKDITQISAYRGVSAEKAKRFASLCLTSEELTILLDEQLTAFNKQDFAKAVAIGHELKFRNSMICEENSLLELAYIYLLIEGEDIEKPSVEVNKKKAALINTEPDLKGFFLRMALQLVGNFSLKQDVDLLSYLEETKAMMIRLSKFMPQG